MKKILLVLGVIVAGAVLFSITALLLVPADLILKEVKKGLEEGPGLVLTEESAEKVFPFGIKARGVMLKNGAENVLFLDTLTARLSPFSLLTGKLRVEYDAAIAEGTLRGSAVMRPGRTLVHAEVEGVDLNSLPALVDSGFNGNGSIDATLELTLPRSGCAKGTLRAKGVGLDANALVVRGIMLPFGEVTETGLRAELKDCKLRLRALWIDGTNMSARATGWIDMKNPIEESRLDLKIEVLPREDGEKLGLLFLLNSYKKSANYYSINLTGTPASPRLSP